MKKHKKTATIKYLDCCGFRVAGTGLEPVTSGL